MPRSSLVSLAHCPTAPQSRFALAAHPFLLVSRIDSAHEIFFIESRTHTRHPAHKRHGLFLEPLPSSHRPPLTQRSIRTSNCFSRELLVAAYKLALRSRIFSTLTTEYPHSNLAPPQYNNRVPHFRSLAWASLIAALLLGLLAAATVPSLTAVQAAPLLQATTDTPTNTPTDTATATATSTPTSTSTPTNTPTPAPGSIVISELRFVGAGGSTDEFVELFNRSCSTTFDLNGWSLSSSDNAGATTLLHQFSSSTPLPPGHYFLLGGTGYAWTTQQSVPDAQFDLGSDIPNAGGVALFLPDGITKIDRVGLSPTSAYIEGTPLGPLNLNTDQGYERHTSALGVVDSNDNLADFSQQPSDPRNSTQTGPCGVPQTPTPTPTRTITPTRTPLGFHPRVMINEVGWAGTGSNHGDQWIELTNPGTQPVDLANWSLETSNGSLIVNLRGVLPVGAFYLLVHGESADATQAATSAPTSPPTTDASACLVFNRQDLATRNILINQVFSGTLSSTGQILYLINSSNGIEDSADRGGGYWPAGNYAPAKSMERSGIIPDSTSGAWFTFEGDPVALNTPLDCDGNHVRGTPGGKNWAYTVTATPSPTPAPTRKPTPRPPTPFAHMVINEFLPRAGTDWNGDGAIDVFDEFVELKNLGPIDINLQGWKIDVLSSGPSTSFNLPGLTLHTGDRVLYYGSQDGLRLPDSGGTVRLFNNRGILIDARSYGPVADPDISHCRIPDGYYWQDACFPTPALENALIGTPPAPPPSAALHPPPCLLADTVPRPFRDAECSPHGADVFNPAFWDDQAGHGQFPVQDVYYKWKTWVQ